MNSVSRKIKVLHLISGSGEAPYLSAIADNCDRTRFALTVASLSPEGVLQDNMRSRGIATFSLACTRRKDYPGALARLFLRLTKERFDIVQTHLFEASLIGLAAARMALTPLTILTAHHCQEHILLGRFVPLMLDKICSRLLAHQIIAPSRDMESNFIRHHGLPKDKITILPNCFDLTCWQTSPEKTALVRAELGLTGKTVFAAVGRLYWLKNYPVLIAAFSPIAKENPNAVLMILGVGPDEASLRHLAAEMVPSGQVVFVGHRPDIISTMSAIDVLVHASMTESFCQVAIEALALGKPVVSSEVGIIPEVVRNGINGYRVPTNDAESITRGMKMILGDRDRWPVMARAAKESVLPYDAKRIVPHLEEKYLLWLGLKDRIPAA